ncbi:MAG TPA: calcium-binding protein, partial [Methylomirabilota bacterium]|nr:calcium-binding protein [Methylomirabilota bacterium]
MATLVGTSLSESISGSRLSDWMAGLAGNDTLIGGPFAFDAGGADTLDGGMGADSLVGGTG